MLAHFAQPKIESFVCCCPLSFMSDLFDVGSCLLPNFIGLLLEAPMVLWAWNGGYCLQWLARFGDVNIPPFMFKDPCSA